MAQQNETREQRRMRYAYSKVSEVPLPEFKEYKSLVEGLGAMVLRNGLAMAMAFLERHLKPTQSERAERLLLDHLAGAQIPGLEDGTASGAQLPDRVRQLPVDAYMLTTRELLRQLAWLKRAAQARAAQLEDKGRPS